MIFDQFNKGVFVVNVLAIIFNSKKKQILIGRRENDPHISELTWCFPGGRPEYEEDLEEYLKIKVKEKTNLDILPKEVIFAKTYPENRKFLSIYYSCEVSKGVEEARGDFAELKWISPDEVEKYFTTSIHSKVLEYLKKLDSPK